MKPQTDYIRHAARLARKLQMDAAMGGTPQPDAEFYKTLSKALDEIAAGLELVAKGRTDHVQLIETAAELAALADRLRPEPLLAVDTEAASFHRYLDRVYLLQISSRDRDRGGGPARHRRARPDRRAARRPGHRDRLPRRRLRPPAAQSRVRLRRRRHCSTPGSPPSSSTSPASGSPRCSRSISACKLDKRFQRADWSARPLSPEMLAYAAADTRYLPQLRDILRDQLTRAGPAGLGARRSSPCWRTSVRHHADQAEPGWLRLKGAKALRGTGAGDPARGVGMAGGRGAPAPTRRRSGSSTTSRCSPWRRTPPRDLAALKAIQGVSSGPGGATRAANCSPRWNAAWRCPRAICRASPPSAARRRTWPSRQRLERLKAARNRWP